jgi:hypothetical protein
VQKTFKASSIDTHRERREREEKREKEPVLDQEVATLESALVPFVRQLQNTKSQWGCSPLCRK